MTKIQAYFPEDLILELKLKAKAEHKNFSQILREGAISILKGDNNEVKTSPKNKNSESKKLKELRKYVGIIKTDGFRKDQNAAEEIDKIVYGV